MLFVGIFDSVNEFFQECEFAELKAVLSRIDVDKRDISVFPNFAIATLSEETLAGGWFISRDDGGVGVVVGQPYLSMSEYQDDAEALLYALRNRDEKELARARGSYCALYFNRHARSLRLITDQVGVYPVYVAKVGHRIYFSNALRMLEGIGAVPKKISIDCLLSRVAFGYPIARETVYENIDCMYGGEILDCDQHGVARKQYWRWGDIKPRDIGAEQLTRELNTIWTESVRIRIGSSLGQLCNLSGGMDSRAIVATLQNHGCTTNTLNFAPDGSKDLVFGRLASEALGTNHFELTLENGNFPARQFAILKAWAAANPDLVDEGVCPNRVWSGDGGSVGIGHVYLDRNFVDLLREKNIHKAALYLSKKNKWIVPLRMLRAEFQDTAKEVPVTKMVAELDSFKSFDPGRDGYLFLLLNDQRRHLSSYFEDLDLNKYIINLPFFDCRLLELVVSAKVDFFIFHELYHQWFKQLGDGVISTPWQTYPEHVPCPLSISDLSGLRDQWHDGWLGPTESRNRRAREMADYLNMLLSKNFPKVILSRGSLLMAWLLTKFKIKDLKYILDDAFTVYLAANSRSR